MKHEKFHYKSLEEVKEKCMELGVDLPFAEDTTSLTKPIDIKK